MKTTILTTSLLAIMAVFITTAALAQDNLNTPGGANTAVTDGTAAGTWDNLWWILPVVAVPVLLYLLWPKKDDRETGSDAYTGGYSGAKGGRASDKDLEDDNSDRVI
jgi:hypothetical protein